MSMRVDICRYFIEWDCLVLPDGDQNFIQTSDPLGGVKGQFFKFHNNSVSFQYFSLKFRMHTEVQ